MIENPRPVGALVHVECRAGGLWREGEIELDGWCGSSGGYANCFAALAEDGGERNRRASAAREHLNVLVVAPEPRVRDSEGRPTAADADVAAIHAQVRCCARR